MPLPFEEDTDDAVVYFRVSRVVGEEGTEVGEFWTEKGTDKSGNSTAYNSLFWL